MWIVRQRKAADLESGRKTSMKKKKRRPNKARKQSPHPLIKKKIGKDQYSEWMLARLLSFLLFPLYIFFIIS